MRAIWKGAITFGMVTIPVKLYGAVEQQKEVRFRLLHKTDHAPIVEKRFCSAEDREVEWDELVRGYEVGKDEYVVVEPREIEARQPEASSTIEIGDFVELEEIDPIYYEKAYYLEPQETGVKPFSLLRRALAETGRVAVARVVLRSRERLATLRVYDETLVLETMHWPDEIRSTRQLDLPDQSEARVAARELEMARSLVESLSSRFDPERYEDRYRVALQELVERRVRGEAAAAKRRKPEPKVVDLMAALEASLRSAKERPKRARSKGTSAKAASSGGGSTRATKANPGSAGRGSAEHGSARTKGRRTEASRRRSAA
ncbi:MAG TPA: Ku protein [Candidatus Limnocylindrales bacterium]|nr:Ku protein [Candidatus Limnocylindrales bacterium]